MTMTAETRTIRNPKNDKSLDTPFTDVEAIQALRSVPGNDFARSLLKQFDRGDGLSAVQMWWVHKLAVDDRREQERIFADQHAASSKMIDLGLTAYSSIKDLFDFAKSNGLKWPKLRFAAGDLTYQLSVAGPNAHVPGSINVTSTGGFDNRTWYGRILSTNEFDPGRDNTDDVTDLLRKLVDDPVGYAAEYGRTVGSCCFCGLTLTTRRSKDAGYGPVCADKWGLPW